MLAASAEEMPVDGAAGPKDNSGAEEADETDGTKFPAVLDVTKEAATEAAGDVEDADEPGGGGEDPELEDVEPSLLHGDYVVVVDPAVTLEIGRRLRLLPLSLLAPRLRPLAGVVVRDDLKIGLLLR